MWTILVPFLQPLFAQLLSKFCPTPVSGQRKDPQVELKGHLIHEGAREFKSESLEQARKTTLRGVKMNNRKVGRKSPDYISLPHDRKNRNNELDEATTSYWLSVLDAPKSKVMAGFKVGCETKLDDELTSKGIEKNGHR